MTQQTTDDEVAFDPAIQSENIAFRPSELVSCDRCERQNAPNRTSCLYCGNALSAGVDANLGAGLRKLETWERGWNLVISDLPDVHIEAAAELCRLNVDHLRSVCEARRPLPILRLETEAIAESLRSSLAEYGANVRVISDDALHPGTMPVRLRKTDLGVDVVTLTDFNTGKVTDVEWTELVLAVSGQVITTKTDSIEKRRRRNKEVTTLDSNESSSDEWVLDLYLRTDQVGYRVNSTGFDFSTLDDGKSMFAAQNMEMLATELRARATGIRYIDDYRRTRAMLDDVWEPESRQDPQGLVRVGFGKQEFGRRYSTDNALQFLKYSRLQWHLL
jgi:hypothetical protein